MMESNVYWNLFCATGEPMAYVLYRNAVQEQETTG